MSFRHLARRLTPKMDYHVYNSYVCLSALLVMNLKFAARGQFLFAEIMQSICASWLDTT